jgi:hypothetical protein
MAISRRFIDRMEPFAGAVFRCSTEAEKRVEHATDDGCGR